MIPVIIVKIINVQINAGYFGMLVCVADDAVMCKLRAMRMAIAK